jgi:hypothetical protein
MEGTTINKKTLIYIAILAVAVISSVVAYQTFYNIEQADVDISDSNVTIRDSNVTLGDNVTITNPTPEPEITPTPVPTEPPINPTPTPKPTPTPVSGYVVYEWYLKEELVNNATFLYYLGETSYFDGSLGHAEFIEGSNVNITYYYDSNSFAVVGNVIWENLSYYPLYSDVEGYHAWSKKEYWWKYPNDTVCVGWCDEIKGLKIIYQNKTADYSLIRSWSKYYDLIRTYVNSGFSSLADHNATGIIGWTQIGVTSYKTTVEQFEQFLSSICDGRGWIKYEWDGVGEVPNRRL